MIVTVNLQLLVEIGRKHVKHVRVVHTQRRWVKV